MLNYEDIEVLEDLAFEEVPIEIQGSRTQVLRRKTIPLAQVLWQHRNVQHVTWEPKSTMRRLYPSLFAY